MLIHKTGRLDLGVAFFSSIFLTSSRKWIELLCACGGQTHWASMSTTALHCNHWRIKAQFVKHYQIMRTNALKIHPSPVKLQKLCDVPLPLHLFLNEHFQSRPIQQSVSVSWFKMVSDSLIIYTQFVHCRPNKQSSLCCFWLECLRTSVCMLACNRFHPGTVYWHYTLLFPSFTS